jgi:hypothetical protein
MRSLNRYQLSLVSGLAFITTYLPEGKLTEALQVSFCKSAP